MSLGKFRPVVESARAMPGRVCMVGSGGPEELVSLCRAAEAGLLEHCLLVGEFPHPELLLGSPVTVEVIPAPPEEACWVGARLTGEGAADVLVKGNVKSSEFLRAVLDRGSQLRTDSILSHLAVLDVPALDYLIGITDGGLNIAPDLRQKQAILRNGVALLRALGVVRPHVAALAATESVNPSMPATLDAAQLAVWAEEHLPSALVEGPLALDLAVSITALERKGLKSRLGGRADLWLVPNIECGNMLVKCLIGFSQALMAGVVMGARVPLVLTSRADQPESKLVSLAVAAAIARHARTPVE